MTADPQVQAQVDHLASEAGITLQAIWQLGANASDDPWADPVTLAKSVKVGILDAPQLRNNPFALGRVNTRMRSGSCVAIGPDGSPIRESDRLAEFLQ
jgi:hypothetical protein